jgi:hypothetical protein
MEDEPGISPYPPSRAEAFAVLLDPLHYVRDADQALACGNRRDAETAITMAYLAFDLIDPDCA